MNRRFIYCGYYRQEGRDYGIMVKSDEDYDIAERYILKSFRKQFKEKFYQGNLKIIYAEDNK